MEENRFKVEVSNDLLSKAHRFFDADLRSILLELVNNSRMAGATEVKITYKEGLLCIEDDGKGIFNDGVEITLGKSEWNDKVQTNEDPAGFGLFVLSNFEQSVIESGDTRVVLTPQVLKGEKEGYITKMSNEINGTIIYLKLDRRFDYTEERLKLELGITFRYFDILIWFNGKKISQEQLSCTVLSTTYEQGLEINVIESYYNHGLLRYYGSIVELRDLKGTSFVHNVQTDKGKIQHLSIYINVIKCPQLQLVLPNRRSVIHNEFYKELKTRCRRIIYEYIATLNTHSLKYEHWKEAQELGVHLKEAEPLLEDWYGITEGQLYNRPVYSDITSSLPILIDTELDEPDILNNLYYASKQQPECGKYKIKFFYPEEKYKGYFWYDSLPRTTAIELCMVDGDEFIPVYELENQLPLDIVNDYKLMIKLEVCNSQDCKFYYLPITVATWMKEYSENFIEDIYIFVDKDRASQFNVDVSRELQSLIFDSYFGYVDDSCADSYDTQVDYCKKEIKTYVDQLLLTPSKSIGNLIQSVIEKELSYELSNLKSKYPDLFPITITIGSESNWIEVKTQFNYPI